MREKQVLALLEDGHDDAAIADALGIKVATAKRYRTRINARRRAAGVSVFLPYRRGRPAGACGARGDFVGPDLPTRPCPRDWPADPERYRAGVA